MAYKVCIYVVRHKVCFLCKTVGSQYSNKRCNIKNKSKNFDISLCILMLLAEGVCSPERGLGFVIY